MSRQKFLRANCFMAIALFALTAKTFTQTNNQIKTKINFGETFPIEHIFIVDKKFYTVSFDKIMEWDLYTLRVIREIKKEEVNSTAYDYKNQILYGIDLKGNFFAIDIAKFKEKFSVKLSPDLTKKQIELNDEKLKRQGYESQIPVPLFNGNILIAGKLKFSLYDDKGKLLFEKQYFKSKDKYGFEKVAQKKEIIDFRYLLAFNNEEISVIDLTEKDIQHEVSDKYLQKLISNSILRKSIDDEKLLSRNILPEGIKIHGRYFERISQGKVYKQELIYSDGGKYKFNVVKPAYYSDSIIGVTIVSYAADLNYIYRTGTPNAIFLIENKTGRIINYRLPENFAAPIQAFNLLPTQNYLAFSKGMRLIEVLSLFDLRPLSVLETKNPWKQFVLMPNKSLLVAGEARLGYNDSSRVVLFDFETKQKKYLEVSPGDVTHRFASIGDYLIYYAGYSFKKLYEIKNINSVKEYEKIPDYILSSLEKNIHDLNDPSASGKFRIINKKLERNEIVSMSSLQNMKDQVTSKDSSIKIEANISGPLRINIQNGNKISIVSGRDKEDIIAYADDGYYMAGKKAVDLVHFIKDDFKVYTFEQFDLHFNRPDIILDRLGLAPKELIVTYRKAWEKRIKKMGFDPENFSKDIYLNAPQVKLSENFPFVPETDNQIYKVSFYANDENYNIERVFITINGTPIHGIKGKILSDKNQALSYSEDIILSPGKNIIKLSVLNEKGIESIAERLEVNYKPKELKKPNLHIIAVGVSKFNQSEYNLTYADKDAKDIVDLFSQNNSKYNNTYIHLIINQDAVKSNILKLRSALEKTNVEDVVVLFFATHGIIDDEFDYYLAMSNMDFANPKNGGLKYDELESLIDGIPARNKLVLIDACHSGEIDKEESEVTIAASSQVESSVKSRGFKVLKTKKSIDLKSSFELMKELFADIRRNNGSIVISSASGQEYAYESSDWTNGVFTYSVISGIKSGAVDLNGDKLVNVSELREYVGEKVKKLTGNKQNPTNRIENLDNDFLIWYY